MSTRFILIALLAPVVYADGLSEDELYHEMQIKVSTAYAQCAAFYEIAATGVYFAKGMTIDDATAMQSASLKRAVLHAQDVEGDVKGSRIANAEFVRNRTELFALSESDSEAFADAMNDYRRSCRMGVIDPSTFIDKTLAVGRWRTAELRLPEGLTVKDLLRDAKPVERSPKISECSRPAVGHLLNLDGALVESGMICPNHHDGVCDSEVQWLSYAQYVEKHYPDNELAGYTEKWSFRFKDGKSVREHTLIACLVVPEVGT